MTILKWALVQLLLALHTLLERCSEWTRWVFTVFRRRGPASVASKSEGAQRTDREPWHEDASLRTYTSGGETMVTVQTSTHDFHVDLEKLCEVSEYFQALAQSSMREAKEMQVQLDHVPSMVFHSLLEFTFHGCFRVPEDDLGAHIQVGSYLLAMPFTRRCLEALSDILSPQNCRAHLDFAQEICCLEMTETVHCYLSRNLLELPHLTRCLGTGLEVKLIGLRMRGSRRLCALRKESLVSGGPELGAAKCMYSLQGCNEDGLWCQEAELPIMADKWSFTTAVLYNYLYLIGGYRHKTKRGYQFKMASFRYNPFSHSWVSTAPLIKHRRHFTMAVCEGSIFAVGGWYLDSLVTPDSSTSLYTAVERYNPWEDSWAFVASLPLTDFRFTMSLSHDVPIAAALGSCLYVVGTIQRTGETLVLQYDVIKDCWTELLPTLTRASADMPSLYFLGCTDRLHIIGGNNIETVVTSFCVESRQWAGMRSTEKMALVGQGTVLGTDVYMPAVEHNSIIRLNLHTLTVQRLPPLPLSTSYEALFHLYF